MKVSELRIGNYVSDIHASESFYAQVKEIRKDRCYYGRFHSAYEDLKPIPLTKEWLLRFGFEKRESSKCTNWHIGENEVTRDLLFDLVWLEKPALIKAPNAPFYRNGRHTIYFVHHLQNLYFALTGQELTIKEAEK